MKSCTLFTFVFLVLFHIGFAQCPSIHHWEMGVADVHIWKYQVPTSSISNWNQPSFNDASWASGKGGMGFGDADDSTQLATSSSLVYMRRTFNIVDTAAIDWAVFCMDFDDGFVAYLNGVEIARANMAPGFSWNAMATANVEAKLYQNLQPGYYTLSPQLLQTLLHNGNNVLAVETHNYSTSTNDLSSRPFLMLGINNTSFNYQAVPSWFTPPTSFASILPLMFIQTNGQTIPDNPKIMVNMGLVDHGTGNTNCVSDTFNAYNGKIMIELRGSTSQWFPKQPYGFSTCNALGDDLNVPLLGCPSEHDWILLNPYTDKTFMRDKLSYDMGRSMNWYASQAKYLELFINGEYQGIYVLLEKIKRDKNRVNIAKIESSTSSGDSLTGGYIFKIDKLTGNSGNPWTTTSYAIDLQNHVPDWDVITPTQQNYLQNYINSFESTLSGNQFTDANLGYRKKANVFSFADLFIINEVSNNLDGYRLSTYIHKDRDSRCGRFTMGPIWDFNLSFGNGNYCNGYPVSGWQMYQGCGDGSSKWINRMLQDTWFKNLLHCRYFDLRQNVLSTPYLLSKVDSFANYLQAAHVRDSTKWQTIGTYVWPNYWISPTWQGEIDSMKNWITGRMAWIDANMFPSTVPCHTLSPAQITIDEMNYHSDSTSDAGDWIELYNAGNSTADLSNMMILDGNSYEKYCTLPNGTVLLAGGRLVVYADSLKFVTQFPTVQNKVGPLCFNLSDLGQSIVLRDKDNKDVYALTYSDSWQCSTDGYGRTLQLTNTTANPNLSTSWFASCMGGSPGTAYTPCDENPIYSEMNYNSAATQDAGDWIELHNKTSSALNISGWSIRDGSNSNLYAFPSGTSIAANGYLVVYSDATKFTNRFPNVNNKVGPIAFGFASGGDVVRIFDATGKIKYSVCYQSISPWPTTPNGGGYTLENGQYNGNANEATSWFAGCPEGSPGKVYDANCASTGVQDLMGESMLMVYPNPTSDFITWNSSLSIQEIRLMDVQGKTMQVIKEGNRLDVRNLSKGVYFLQLKSGEQWFSARFVKQ